MNLVPRSSPEAKGEVPGTRLSGRVSQQHDLFSNFKESYVFGNVGVVALIFRQN